MSTETDTGFETERMNIGREAPALSRALVALEREIRIDGVLRELVKLRASILNGCAYCIDMHTKDARKAGESEQRLYAVAAWHEAPFFSERERAALALTDAVTLVAETPVPADVYEQAARHFDAEELAHLIWQIATINAWNRVAVAARETVGGYPAVAGTARGRRDPAPSSSSHRKENRTAVHIPGCRWRSRAGSRTRQSR